ncbi:MAG TPA: hypothetical protein GX505_05440 [Clostridiales bacterium]|nr:hypothetical protein [Clostridiales bacterium]
MKKRIILITLLVLVLAIGGYAMHFWYQINNPESLFGDPPVNNPDPADNPAAADPGETLDPVETEEPYQFDENRVNILLLGLDADEDRYQTMGAFRTDTIILASIDFSESHVYLISIPRDSYVKIWGRKEKNRVNAAFVFGGGFKGKGFETTIKTVQDLMGGIPIHYYAAIDMNVFVEIIDRLGGITYEVDVPISYAGLEPGLQKLNGRQALAYARHRKTAGGDIDRVGRQQKLLISILSELKSTNSLTKLPGIFDAVKDDMWTNLNIKQIAALALFASRLNVEEDIERFMIPGNYLTMDKMSLWGIDQKKKNELLNELFGLNITTYDKEEDVYYIKEQLRKKLDELKALGQKWLNEASKTLAQYGEVLLDKEVLLLNDGITLLDKAMKEGEIDDIETTVMEIEKYLTELTPSLDKRKEEMTAGKSVLALVESELPGYKFRISAADLDKLNGKIALLRSLIEQKKFSEIGSAASDLNAFWTNLKKKLETEPTAKPSPTPHPTQAPTPTPSPTAAPTATPNPTVQPTPDLTAEPTVQPTSTPDSEPTAAPSGDSGNEG